MTFPSSGIAVYAPTFTVKLKKTGETIQREDITRVELVEDLEKPGEFVISLNDMLDMKTQKFRWLDDKRIQPGALIEISLSYASSQNKNTLLFIGRIKSVTHNFASSTLEVIGYDLSHDLQESWRGDDTYKKKKYSQIIADIAYANKLKRGKLDETKTVIDSVSRKPNLQSAEDDYEFIKRLTKAIGFEFFVREESYYFQIPQEDKDAEITFTNGINIVNFSYQLNISHLVNEVQLNSWDEDKKEGIYQTAKLADIEKCVYIPPNIKNQIYEKGIVEYISVPRKEAPSAEEAKIRAIAELKIKNKDLFTGHLESIGNSSLRPGMTVKVEKIGEYFSGIYYVEKATHLINENGYSTTLNLRRCR